MARKGDLRVLAVGLMALWTAACGGTGAGEDGIETQQAALTTTNALSMNALSMNALSMNALSMNALSMNALSMNALSTNALIAPKLSDPLARQFLKYVVSCALPDDQTITMSVDGTTYSFPGGLGLAPEWGQKGGMCDTSCQRWVSACVLSRVDYLAVERPISLRGASPALRTTLKEMIDFPAREATYYGNLWADGAPKFACLSPGQKEIERVCGDSLDNCPMEVVGSCAKACAYQGLTGGFVDCSSTGKARKPEIFHESVTVFLPRSEM
ncbi:MAG TPA: hypothetical protein VHJ20_22880 [Polyangia bacterium]|nr:hypothetical protein [Polyangia bacterium]